MTAFLLILTIICGIATITTFIITLCAKDRDVREIYSILCIILLAFTGISAECFYFTRPEKPHEFPATKYELKYKVTEFDGVSDTTYVLVPKK